MFYTLTKNFIASCAVLALTSSVTQAIEFSPNGSQTIEVGGSAEIGAEMRGGEVYTLVEINSEGFRLDNSPTMMVAHFTFDTEGKYVNSEFSFMDSQSQNGLGGSIATLKTIADYNAKFAAGTFYFFGGSLNINRALSESVKIVLNSSLKLLGIANTFDENSEVENNSLTWSNNQMHDALSSSIGDLKILLSAQFKISNNITLEARFLKAEVAHFNRGHDQSTFFYNEFASGVQATLYQYINAGAEIGARGLTTYNLGKDQYQGYVRIYAGAQF